MSRETLRQLLDRAAAAIAQPVPMFADEKQQLVYDLQKCRSPDAHPLVGQSFPVLDQGFVKLVRFMGGDAEIVEAARLTAQSEGREIGSDRSLLRFLMRHNHSTPIEFFEIVLHVRCPMDTWRQWIRHRTANVNEYSTRYTAAIDACQQTPPDQWRLQSTNNRQGSSGLLTDWPPELYDTITDAEGVHHQTKAPSNGASVFIRGDVAATPGDYLSGREQAMHAYAREVYEERLAFGVAKEQARKDLPLSNYTEAYWKIDGGNLLNFLRLRMDGHAQKEIRDFATVIGEQILSQICPLLWEAFNDYIFHAMKLTRLDQVVIKNLVTAAAEAMTEVAATTGLEDREAFKYLPPYPLEVFLNNQYDEWKPIAKCRERDECLAKLQKLGLVQAA